MTYFCMYESIEYFKLQDLVDLVYLVFNGGTCTKNLYKFELIKKLKHSIPMMQPRRTVS